MTIEMRYEMSRGGFHLDVNLKVPHRGVTAIYGRSGTGKTTLLRCIAGLERPSVGILKTENFTWQDERHFVPCHMRSIGLVFQHPGLFPHLNVRQNILYGYKRRAANENQAEVEETIEVLGLARILDKTPGEISGGETRRVAIARALLARPKLLLMDEPLTHQDETTRQEILRYLERLFVRLEIPVLYVSHNRDELDRLALYHVEMDNGRIKFAGDKASAEENRKEVGAGDRT